MDTSRSASKEKPDRCPSCGNLVIIKSSKPDGDMSCPHCRALLWFVRRSAGDAVVVTFLPGLVCAADSLQRVTEVFAAASGSPKVVLNLEYMPFMSSTFINMLVAVSKLMRPEGKVLRAFGLNPDILKTFKVTNIDSLFAIYDDEKAALSAGDGGGPS